MTDPCVICARNTNSKAKPGIFPCIGCDWMFCTHHVMVHRQELANEFDIIIGERNEIPDTFDRHPNLPDAAVQLNLIDKWVEKTIEQVNKVADDMRQRIIRLVEEQKTNIEEQFSNLSKQLDTFRENENFVEKDIKNLKEKCTHLKHLLSAVNIKLTANDVLSNLVQAVSLQQTKETAVKPLSFIENLIENEVPYKRIRMPHEGTVRIGKDYALVGNDDNWTMIDFKTDSLTSITIPGGKNLIFCWSLCVDGFLCANSRSNQQLQVLRKTEKSLEKTYMTYVAIEKPRCMVCFSDRLMFVCYGLHEYNEVQEWSFGDSKNSQTQLANQINRWRPPLTCAKEEDIINISFDDQRIVLVVRCKPTSWSDNGRIRIEFRSRNMHTIRQFNLDCSNTICSSVLCRLNNGWLLTTKQTHIYTGSDTWQSTFIDNDLYRCEQKDFSAYNIKDIEVVEWSSDKSVLGLHRANKSLNASKYGPSSSILDLYEI